MSKQSRSWLLIVGMVLLMGIVSLARLSQRSARPADAVVIAGTAVPPVPTLDPARVALGETVYATHCASCHGANLEGQADWGTLLENGLFRAPPHDDSGHTWHHPDKVLIAITTHGGAGVYADPTLISNMPGFEDALTPEEIVAVLDFIKSCWSQESHEAQWWMTVTSADR